MSQIVEAAIQSTERYLNHLTEQERGVEHHPSKLREGTQSEPCYVNGHLHFKYLFRCGQNLSFRPDDRLYYLPRETGERIEVKVLKYDRPSGDIDLAFTQESMSTEGNLEVDFKWLIRRTLEWFREHGSKIEKAPWEFDHEALYQITKSELEESGLNEDQIQSVTKNLSKKFTYTWGPPGCGKTQFALAHTARQVAISGHRILVLAPTNNAVDNAMRSILKLCDDDLPRTKFVRLGIPTTEFAIEHPDVCEDIEVKEKLEQLMSEIGEINTQISDIEKLKQIQNQVIELENRINILKNDARHHWDQMRFLNENIDKITENVKIIEDEFIKSKQDEKEALMAKAALPPLALVFSTKAKTDIELRLSRVASSITANRLKLSECRAKQALFHSQRNNHESDMKILAFQIKKEQEKLSSMVRQRQDLIGSDFVLEIDELETTEKSLNLKLDDLKDAKGILELNLAENPLLD